MTGRDIDSSVLKKAKYFVTGIVFAVLMGVCLIALIAYGLLNFYDLFGEGISSNGEAFIAMACMSVMCFGMLMLIFLILGVSNKSRIKNYVKAHGEDEVMNAINNARYVYAVGKKPVTIITDDFIYEVGVGFVTNKFDLAYGYSYKGTSILAFTIGNKRESICRGIALGGNEKNKVFEALRYYNPEILLGYTNDNLVAHRKRVKENRGNYQG